MATQCDTTGHAYAHARERVCTYCGALRELPRLIPTTVNGLDVIVWGAIPDRDGYKRGRSIIVADKGEGAPQRYVVAMHVEGEDGWHVGDYISDRLVALKRFNERLAIALGLPTGWIVDDLLPEPTPPSKRIGLKRPGKRTS